MKGLSLITSPNNVGTAPGTCPEKSFFTRRASWLGVMYWGIKLKDERKPVNVCVESISCSRKKLFLFSTHAFTKTKLI